VTGETGAGKSIILDAIDAALGQSDRRVIRTGANRQWWKPLSGQALAAWLAEQEIELLMIPR